MQKIDDFPKQSAARAKLRRDRTESPALGAPRRWAALLALGAPRRWAALLALGALSLASSSALATDSVSSLNVIEFRTQVRASEGVVRCGLFNESGWLKRTVQPALAKINGKTALCVFRGVPKGTYGISAFHDENSNGKLDTTLGIPNEDYCASRNARGTFGPPSFDDAKFDYTGGTKRLQARMK